MNVIRQPWKISALRFIKTVILLAVALSLTMLSPSGAVFAGKDKKDDDRAYVGKDKDKKDKKDRKDDDQMMKHHPKCEKRDSRHGDYRDDRDDHHGRMDDDDDCASPPPPPPLPPGSSSCQPSSALVAQVGLNPDGTPTGDVTAYVPKGYWSGGATNVSVVNVEGSSITPQQITTPNIVNSCAANFLTGQTVCTANNTDVYVITGTTLTATLTSAGSGTLFFSGGRCTNCGVAMDPVHNRALIALSLGGAGGYQYLNLGPSPTFEPAFASQAPLGFVANISEDILIDPIRNLILSPNEANNYELVNVATTTSPTFFENAVSGVTGELDSAGEDCSTGIALAPAEFSGPSQVYIADLTQATFTPGSPAGTWSAPSQVQVLSESFLAAGASGIAVAQGTHIGLVTGEFGGDALTAITLPTTSGSGTPAISDWVTCSIGNGFSMGFDPHTVTAYQSPSSANAIGLVSDGSATTLAVVNLTQMLNPTIVPRTVGGHACASGTLPATVLSTIAVP